MRVVVAPDSFKGSIGAAAAAAAIAVGWRQVRPADEVIELPLADGGEGTASVVAAAMPASRWRVAEVCGPAEDHVTAGWLEIPGNGAVVELATAAGLPLLRVPSPLTAHSFGVGQLIGMALDAGARRVDVALGGSACTDGGTGALAALGARFLDADGCELPLGGGGLSRLASVDLSGLRPRPADGTSCLTDVRAPLLGPGGAAAVFGPQKGAAPADIAVLEAGLERLAGLLGGDPDAPGAGAAGGCAYGLAAAWSATLQPGAERIAAIAGLPAALERADLVITGEGRYDATSLTGKVVGAVLEAALAARVAVFLVAGQVDFSAPRDRSAVTDRWAVPDSSVPPDSSAFHGRPAGLGAVELIGLAGSPMAAMAEPGRWLTDAGRLLAEGQAA
jgi:glycerate kinase